MIKLTIDIYVFNTCRVGEDTYIILNLYNNTSSTLPAGYVVNREGKYYQRRQIAFNTMIPESRQTIRLPLPVYGFVTPNDVPSKLDIHIDGARIDMLNPTFSYYSLRLNDYKPVIGETLRIALIGQQGATKSSFINNVIGMKRGVSNPRYAITGSGYGPVTMRTSKFCFSDCTFSFTDTVGITCVNYDIDAIKNIIRGVDVSPQGSYVFDTQADVVVFFVTAETINSDDDEWRSMYINWFRACNTMEVPFIFMISCMDKIDVSLATNPNIKPRSVEDIIDRVRSRTGLEPSKIDYNVNHYDKTLQGEHNNFEVDRKLYKSITKILDEAVSANRRRKSITDNNNSNGIVIYNF